MNHYLAAVFFCTALWLGGGYRSVSAQDGPGLPNLQYNDDEVFEVLSRYNWRNGAPRAHGNAAMHNGYMVLIYSNNGSKFDGGFSFYDISNPRSPVLVRQKDDDDTQDIREAHGYGFSNSYPGDYVALQATLGVQIWDWSDVRNPEMVSYAHLPGIEPTDYSTAAWWLCWQAPYIYVGGSSNGIYIVDASDAENPVMVDRGGGLPNPVPISQMGGFRIGPIFAVGNLLVATNANEPGVVTFDISDPKNPEVLDIEAGGERLYSSMVNGDKVLVAGVNKKFYTLDISDPADIRFTNEKGLNRGAGYVTFQDGYAHLGASDRYVKIDIRDDNNYRIVGSASSGQEVRDEDFAVVMGNLVVVSDDHGDVSILAPHQSQKDTRGPEVNMVNPKDGATGQMTTSRVGVTFTDLIDLRSVNGTTFIVRPVGGDALSGKYSTQTGIVNFFPDVLLQPGTKYEVVIPKNGIKDYAGNETEALFRSEFTTGGILVLSATIEEAMPTTVGSTVRFRAIASGGSGQPEYYWVFGDGDAELSSFSEVDHVYDSPGHFTVTLTVDDGSQIARATTSHTCHYEVQPIAPTSSRTILLTEDETQVWNVNPDNNTVTAIEVGSLRKDFEVSVGRKPTTLAQAPDGTIWVVNQRDATITVVDSQDGSLVYEIDLPYASQPFGIAFSPNGGAAYVTLQATGGLLQLDPLTRSVLDEVDVGPAPRGLAISSDSERIFVTRFVSSQDHGDVVEVGASSFSVVRTIDLAIDPGPDLESLGRGVPNYLISCTISPDGRRLLVPSKKDNIERGVARDGLPLTFENSVRTVVSQVDLLTNQERLSDRIDLNDHDFAINVAFSPLGGYAFVASQGSNMVDVFDVYTGNLVAAFLDVGRAPQGLVLSSDGKTLFVHSFLSRSVLVYDVSDIVANGGGAVGQLADISTVSSEELSAQVLEGKRLFYNAADARMNLNGYLSCASCHVDGGSDERVWDFTDRGEGFRNTISLHGRRGTGHGRVHWSANFDEIQDFEHDIRGAFRGRGFMSDAEFNSGTRNQSLGDPKAGLSRELDAIAAYVASLVEVPPSPHRNSDGSLTADGEAGKTIFESLQCASCHAGNDFTDSPLDTLHDVGTIKSTSGSRLGQPITGLDTPTLKGVWATAPYLHDGSAPALMDVLTTLNPFDQHGATSQLNQAELQQLVAYLLQIDENETGGPQPPQVTGIEPPEGIIGTRVTLWGAGFIGTTQVDFEGASAQFTIFSDNEISTDVPDGAASGFVLVRNGTGVAQSPVPFVVTEEPATVRFAPLADTQTKSNSIDRNYGSDPTIRVRDGSPSYHAFLKFEVSGVQTVQSASLRLFVTDYGPDGGAIALTSNNYIDSNTPWTEDGLVWGNEPDVDAPFANIGPAPGDEWIEVDVSNVVSGPGVYSFGLGGTSTNSVYYSSKEGSHPPELVIQTSGSGGTDEPDIAATPASKDFGEVVTATTVSQTFEILNTGTVTLNVSGTSLTGSDANEFAISSGGGSFSVQAGGKHDIEVSFTPTSLGSKSATLRLSSNDPDENPFDISLAGMGVPTPTPDIATDPSTLLFGNVVQGATSRKPVEVRNDGTVGLTVSNVQTTGADAGDFSAPTAGFTLTPGATKTVNVDFTPGSLASKNAGLEISSDDPDESVVSVPLSGTGIEAPVGGGEVAYEQTQTGNSVTSNAVTTSAVLTAADDHLYLAAISVRRNIAVTGVSGLGLTWSRTEAQCAARGQTRVEVWQAIGSPTSDGVVTATFAATVASAVISVSRYSGVDATNPIGVTVFGNSSGPSGSCSGGSDSPAYDFNLTTRADSAVVFAAAALRNRRHTPGSSYTERSETSSGSGGDTAGLATEDRKVTSAATVVVDGAFSSDVDWAAVGVEIRPGQSGPPPARPDIALQPESHDFGDVLLGLNAAQSFEVGNTGTADLTVSATSLIGTHASDFQFISGQGAFILPAGGTRNLQVQFTPGTAGTRTATLQIISDDPDESLLGVALTGLGVAQPEPDIAANPASKNFGEVVTTTTVLQVFEIQNTGSATLDVTGTSLTGNDASEFDIVSGDGAFSIPAGGKHGIGISFTPTSLGAKSSALSVSSNDPDESPFDIPLSGSGVPMPTPDIAANLTSLAFGDVVQGATFGMSLEIRNNGTADLTVGEVQVTGADVGDFSTATAGFTLAANASKRLTVNFTPGSLGSKNASLEISSDDPDESVFSVSLAGTGVEVSVGGGEVVYEETQTGGSVSSNAVTTSAALTAADGHLYLAAISARRNIALAGVTGLGLSWSRTEAQCAARGQTRVEVWQAIGSIGGNGVVTATFLSSVASAAISVSRYSGVDATDPVGATVFGNSSGTSGSCSGGSDSRGYDFNLTISRDDAVVFAAAALRNRRHTPGADYSERSEVSSGSGGGTAGLATEDRKVTWAATVVVDGSYSSDVDWAVIGVEIQPGQTGPPPPRPDIAVSPGSHDFGDVELGLNSAQSFEVRNTGTAGLTVSATSLIGAHASDFQFLSGQGAFILPVGGTRNIQVRFTPGGAGVRNATLQITSDDLDEGLLGLTLTGRGVAQPEPDIAANPASKNFGDVVTTTTVSQTFEIQNTGSATLNVNGTSLTDSDASEFDVVSGGGTFSIPAGGKHDMEISFTPTSLGGKSAALRLNSNDPDENPFDIPLQGAGIAAPVPDIAVQPDFHDFGDIFLGSSASHTFELSNGGQADLVVFGTSLMGADAGEFSIDNGGGSFTLAAAASRNVQVSYAPTGTGTKNATLRFVSNDSFSNPLDVALAGTGVAQPQGGGEVVFEEVSNGQSVSSISVTSAPISGHVGHFYLAAVSFRALVEVTEITGLGLTWQQAQSQCSGRSQTGVEVWYAIGTPSGDGIVTAKLSAATSSALIAVVRYSGVNPSTPLGDIVSGNSNGASGGCTGGSDSPTYQFDLQVSLPGAVVFGAAALRNRSHNAGAGFVERVEIYSGSSGATSGLAVQDRPATAAGLLTLDGAFNKDVDWAVVGVEILPSPASSAIAAQSLAVDVAEIPQSALPQRFELMQNYPNPFNAETTISYALPEATKVRMSIYNIRGQLVRLLLDEQQSAGFRKVRWDGRDSGNLAVSSGIYLLHAQIGARKFNRKLLLQK